MKNLLLLCPFMLSACCWEHQIALHPGDASINRSSICISSSGGKNLSGYALDARALDNHYAERDLVVSETVNARTPYCFKLNLDSYMEYTLYYELDDVNYTVPFITDDSPIVYTKAYSN